MYTQCTHCKAIFRVNMREVTVAKGKLRCSECQSVFTATETLSTTIPEAFTPEKEPVTLDKKQSSSQRYSNTPPDFTIKGVEENYTARFKKRKSATVNPSKLPNTARKPKAKIQKYKNKGDKPKTKKNRAFLIVSLFLGLLLLAQVLYHYRDNLLGNPKHQPELIQMLNHNVFTHPNESDTLIISATMESNAEKPQPFPILEVRLINKQSKVVALRRFKPTEYLDNYSPKLLLPVKVATSLRLKIKDPGSDATGFQFNFY